MYYILLAQRRQGLDIWFLTGVLRSPGGLAAINSLQHPRHLGQDAKGAKVEAVGLRKHEDLNGQEHAEWQPPGHSGHDAKGVKGQAAGPREHEDLNGQKHAELQHPGHIGQNAKGS